MENKIKDASNIKNLVVGKALFQTRIGINNHCSKYHLFGGLCDMDKCLYCENCYYRITLETGEAISNTVIDYDKLEKACIGSDRTKEILFYDRVPKIDDLFNYEFDDNSQYSFKNIDKKKVK